MNTRTLTWSRNLACSILNDKCKTFEKCCIFLPSFLSYDIHDSVPLTKNWRNVENLCWWDWFVPNHTTRINPFLPSLFFIQKLMNQSVIPHSDEVSTSLCRWICSVPDHITRIYLFYPYFFTSEANDSVCNATLWWNFENSVPMDIHWTKYVRRTNPFWTLYSSIRGLWFRAIDHTLMKLRDSMPMVVPRTGVHHTHHSALSITSSNKSNEWFSG